MWLHLLHSYSLFFADIVTVSWHPASLSQIKQTTISILIVKAFASYIRMKLFVVELISDVGNDELFGVVHLFVCADDLTYAREIRHSYLFFKEETTAVAI